MLRIGNRFRRGSRRVRPQMQEEKSCFEPSCGRVKVDGVSKSASPALTLAAPPTVGQLRRLLPVFCKKHGITRAEVFGSVAAGRALPGSDVDLIVSFAPGQTPGFRFFDLLEELERLLGVRVDVLTETGLATIENPILRAAILANKQVVYAEPGVT